MTNTNNVQGSTRNTPSLDSRYGEIGIPAVAAALKFKGDAKHPDQAPAPQQQAERWYEEWTADLAA